MENCFLIEQKDIFEEQFHISEIDFDLFTKKKVNRFAFLLKREYWYLIVILILSLFFYQIIFPLTSCIIKIPCEYVRIITITPIIWYFTITVLNIDNIEDQVKFTVNYYQHYTHIHFFYHHNSNSIDTEILHAILPENICPKSFIKRLATSLCIFNYFYHNPLKSSIRFWPEIFIVPILTLLLLSNINNEENHIKLFIFILIFTTFLAVIYKTYVFIHLLKQTSIHIRLIKIYCTAINIAPTLRKFIKSDYFKQFNYIFAWQTIFPFLSMFGGK